MKYSRMTLQYFETAPLAGTLSGSGVVRGQAGSLSQGTWVQFDLKLADGVIEDARFQAFGCPHVIAVAAWCAESAVGQSFVDAAYGGVHALRERFEVPVEKLGRLLIVEDAWNATVALAKAHCVPHIVNDA